MIAGETPLQAYVRAMAAVQRAQAAHEAAVRRRDAAAISETWMAWETAVEVCASLRVQARRAVGLRTGP